MRKKQDIIYNKNSDIIVKTHRSGVFKFQVGIHPQEIEPLMDRVLDAHRRFATVPMLPQIAKELEQSVIVASVFGTNTIEGGTLSEAEISEIFEENMPVENVKEDKKRRVMNIRTAYELADKLANNRDEVMEGERGIPFELEEPLLIQLHEIITGGLNHPTNIPGQYRNNTKGFYTKVGDIEHGGVYTPPKCLDDIKMLVGQYILWINSDPVLELHPLIRAPLAHYYFERIHPFSDGNGRVGRVIEAIILQSSGMMYAPFGLAKSYLEHIDEYFTVFNTSRKLENDGYEFPNTPFVIFFLHRIREVFDLLHGRVNYLIGHILYENMVNSCLREKTINERQYMIINNLLPKGYRHSLRSMQSSIWYTRMYQNLTRRTRDRDLQKLVELSLIKLKDKEIRLLVP